MPRNLGYRTVAADGKPLAQRQTLIALFCWAEERIQCTIDWYLWRKTSRARLVGILPRMCILLGIVGGITPVLHARCVH